MNRTESNYGEILFRFDWKVLLKDPKSISPDLAVLMDGLIEALGAEGIKQATELMFRNNSRLLFGHDQPDNKQRLLAVIDFAEEQGLIKAEEKNRLVSDLVSRAK